jgi:hypothetical protein
VLLSANTAELIKAVGETGWYSVRRYPASSLLLPPAITFLITSAPAARKVLWWRDDLKVLGFKSNEYILVGNDGDGPVYVSHANLVMDLAPFGKRTVTQRLNTLVPQDTILSIGITPGFKGETKYVGSPSLEVWNIALQRTIRGDNNCFWPVVFAASDLSFLIVREAYSSQSQALRTFPALATVGYYSLYTKQLREFNMPVVGAIAFRDVSECTKSP